MSPYIETSAGLLVPADAQELPMHHGTNGHAQELPYNALIDTLPVSPAVVDHEPAHLPETPDEPADSTPAQPAAHGRTRQVQEREQKNAEAAELLRLQEQDCSHEVDTKRVRRARKRGAVARKLRVLRSQPDAVALRDARVRLWTTLAALVAAVAALGWSTASVQHTVADGAAAWSSAWVLAFLVEPLISIGLLATIGVQAYAAMRGHVVDPGTEHGRTLRSTQRWLLGLTVTLNTWPYVSPLWTGETFSLIQVIVHLVGPIVAVRMIHTLPAMWGVLESLPIPGQGRVSRGVTPPECSDNSAPTEADGKPSRADEITTELRELLASGRWTKNVSVPAIRSYFGCGTPIATTVRNRFQTAN